MVERVVRLGKRGNSRGVNLPLDMINAMGWEHGTLIRVLVVSEGILLVKAEFAPSVALRGKQIKGRSE